MQGGKLVVPTPGVVNADEAASPVVPAEPAGLVVSGAQPGVVLRPDVAVGDAVVEPIVEPGSSAPDVVPIDPLVALPIVLGEPDALVPGDDRELPLSPVPELNVVVEPGELVVEPGELIVPATEPGLVVPGTLVLAPGILVVAPGTPTLEPGTVEAIGALDIVVASGPAVGTHGRAKIGCPVGFVIGTGGFA